MQGHGSCVRLYFTFEPHVITEGGNHILATVSSTQPFNKMISHLILFTAFFFPNKPKFTSLMIKLCQIITSQRTIIIHFYNQENYL